MKEILMRSSKKEFLEICKNKHILFDANVFIFGFGHYKEFEELCNFLIQAKCVLACFSLVEFEFLRTAHEPKNKEKRENLLKEFREISFIVDDARDDMIKIANAYTARRITGASAVDCCIATLLKKHNQQVILATLNHKDFPTFLFDRIFIYPIDTDKDIFTLAFYRFNVEKAKKIKIM